jgi:hypothetical protein
MALSWLTSWRRPEVTKNKMLAIREDAKQPKRQ